MSSRLRAHASNRIGIRPSGGQTTFKKGDLIAQVKIAQVKKGGNGKVAVVGRKMNGHVEKVAFELENQGYQVELFNKQHQEQTIFNIEGENKTWEQIENDFQNGSYIRDPNNNRILENELSKTMMYKANKIWANKLKSENYEVLDVGYPEGTTSKSIFYDMELFTIFE
jgi:hypothetical protein